MRLYFWALCIINNFVHGNLLVIYKNGKSEKIFHFFIEISKKLKYNKFTIKKSGGIYENGVLKAEKIRPGDSERVSVDMGGKKE